MEGERVITMKQRLSDIALMIDWSEVAEQYFHRTPHWIYQRMSGHIVNGKPAAFTDEQKEELRQALLDMARRLEDAAEKIE